MAAELLGADWKISADVWSVTSFSELARDANETERWNRLHPTLERKTCYVSQCLQGDAPVIAATDYIRAYPHMIAGFIDAPYVTLGTDGFGRSDSRAALRRFFEVDRYHIAVAALHALAQAGVVTFDLVAEAINKYELDAELSAPWKR